MRYLPGASQMKKADAYTIEELGVSSMDLMERAAAGCVKYMEEQKMNLSHVCVVCGSGNNGGDGFAIARILTKKGYRVCVYFGGNPSHMTKECRIQRQRFADAGGSLAGEFQEDGWTVLVDALFGVGLSREIEGRYLELIESMNRADGVKVAVDLPSGICADTGNILGTAFAAEHTVTFQNQKLGMELYPGKAYAGQTCVIDIGISSRTFKEDLHVAFTLDGEDCRKLLPNRYANSNKGTYGRLLVIAGSRGMSGAAYFNAKAAYRVGAGLVQIYTPEENRVILQQSLPDAIITTYELYDETELLRLLRWADAVCIGSGIGTGDKAKRILRTVLEEASVPCVVDADGINLLAEHPKFLDRKKHANYILTPHMKEMSRVSGLTVAEIQKDRMKILEEYVSAHQLTCVLKDARTVVQKEGMRPFVNTTGNAAMAKAGSGDVLTGMIAGLLVQGKSCEDAAVFGTWLHGMAGDRAKEKLGSYSVMAEDLMEQVCVVMKEEESR